MCQIKRSRENSNETKYRIRTELNGKEWKANEFKERKGMEQKAVK